jgi:hypothetical protein
LLSNTIAAVTPSIAVENSVKHQATSTSKTTTENKKRHLYSHAIYFELEAILSVPLQCNRTVNLTTVVNFPLPPKRIPTDAA